MIVVLIILSRIMLITQKISFLTLIYICQILENFEPQTYQQAIRFSH